MSKTVLINWGGWEGHEPGPRDFYGTMVPQIEVFDIGVHEYRPYHYVHLAARVDGSGEFRTFFTMVLRIMRPALVTVFLFQFVAIWNNFFLPLVVLSRTDLFPVTLGLYAWQGQALGNPDIVSLVITGSLIASLPLVVLFFSLQGYWRTGATAGAVKG